MSAGRRVQLLPMGTGMSSVGSSWWLMIHRCGQVVKLLRRVHDWCISSSWRADSICSPAVWLHTLLPIFSRDQLT